MREVISCYTLCAYDANKFKFCSHSEIVAKALHRPICGLVGSSFIGTIGNPGVLSSVFLSVSVSLGVSSLWLFCAFQLAARGCDSS
jgi:hypothetical protein